MKRKDKALIATTAATLALVAFSAFSALEPQENHFEASTKAPAPAAAEVITIVEPNPYEALALKLATDPDYLTPEVTETTTPKTLGTFQLTAYCACPACCGEWADGRTFTGTEATEGRTVAVDPDVIPLGSSVYIDGQEYIAEDIGGAIQGNRVDVFFNNHADALEFGVQYAEVSVK